MLDATIPPTSNESTPTPAPPAFMLWAIFWNNRRSLAGTYALFGVENVLILAKPLVFGLAIDGLLEGSLPGLVGLVAVHLTHVGIGVARRSYDTRAFTAIYSDVAARMITEQRGHGADVSRVAARSTLSREFVDFFEHQVPMLVQGIFGTVGALLVLATYDFALATLCLCLAGPAWLVNRIYARTITGLNTRLHDELEREIDVIEKSDAGEVKGHFERVAGWRVRLSDAEALNFGVMELFTLLLVAAALLRSCAATATAGDILAIFRYVLTFIMSLDVIPLLIHHLIRLQDIGNRIRQRNLPESGNRHG